MSVVLLVIAIVCFVVAAFLGFGVFGGGNILGWISVGLVAFAGAHLPLPDWRAP